MANRRAPQVDAAWTNIAATLWRWAAAVGAVAATFATWRPSPCLSQDLLARLRIQICSNLDNDLLDMGFDRSARDPPTFQRRLHGRNIELKQDFRSFDPRIPGLAHQARNTHFRFHPLAQIARWASGKRR